MSEVRHSGFRSLGDIYMGEGAQLWGNSATPVHATYSYTTAAETLASITVPAGFLDASGQSMKVTVFGHMTNSGDSVNLVIGGVDAGTVTAAAGSVMFEMTSYVIQTAAATADVLLTKMFALNAVSEKDDVSAGLDVTAAITITVNSTNIGGYHLGGVKVERYL